jgi:hypothetical protein
VTASPGGPLAVLQRIREQPARPRPGEVCDMCATPIAGEHPHVADLDGRGLRCACRACALLFTQAGGRYRTVPARYVVLAGFEMSPGQWDELGLPVSMAFFLHSSRTGEVSCFYPSPAGATESLLPLDAWARIEERNRALSELQSDVEALLIRVERAQAEAFIVPIDACYELVGHLRRLWKGFDGGREARDQMEAFFDRVRSGASVG